MILFNLDFEDLKKCQLLNKSFKDILEDPMFWLRKWRMQKGLSKKNYDDWVKAIQLTKNTNVEVNVQLYLEKVIETGHVVDVPCFIDSDAIQNSTKFTYKKALKRGSMELFRSWLLWRIIPIKLDLIDLVTLAPSLELQQWKDI